MLALLGSSLLLQWWLFAGHVQREVAWAYPGWWDQLASLQVSYEGYEQARQVGARLALRNVLVRDHPLGLLLPVGGLVAFVGFGPSRVHALALTFGVYAVLQIGVVLILRRLAGWAPALLGWGLTWALRAAYLQPGGLADFRADFAAACLFAMFLGLALRGNAFASIWWSVLAGVAAAACVWARFLTVVYIATTLAAFAAVMLVRHHGEPDPESRRLARARCLGAAVTGVLMVALAMPALWAQRDGIDAHYFKGILGPLRSVRAQVVGADHPLGNLVFYPYSLLGQVGGVWWIVAGAVTLGLAYETLRKRREGRRGELSASTVLLALSFLVPLVTLTALTSKSTVVGVILAAPLLWALPLAAARWSQMRASRAGRPVGAWPLAMAAAVALAGAAVQTKAWRVRRLPLERSEVTGVFALHDAVARDSRERRLPAPLLSVDHVSDHLNALALSVSTYERTGRLMRARLGLGSAIGSVSEPEALGLAGESDYVILTAARSGALGPYPADRSLEAAGPALRAFCERAMRPLGRYRTPGREVLLFARRESDLLPAVPSWGPSTTRVEAFLARQPAVVVAPTGLLRADYLDVVERQVRAFRTHQDGSGAIVDPVAKREWQYATPCYAMAVAALVAAGRGDAGLLASGLRAMDASVAAMAEYRPADRHGDFFTYPVMRAYVLYGDRAAPDRRAGWRRALASIDPYRLYLNALGPGRDPLFNWNIVASSGEYLRAAQGLSPDLRFTERHLEHQIARFDALGLYRDPGSPLAYDAFARYHLVGMLTGGYRGVQFHAYRDHVWRGAWTSLFMMSPAGESPAGGRSAHHLWNEAQAAAIFETYATEYARSGRPAEAGAFKRAARLSLACVRRWIRPDGTGYVVKNRYPIEARHGYEHYSSHSQYNLLAASMLVAAHLAADDAIAERASPADVGGFVLAMEDGFHKVMANAGGAYVEYDTSGDGQNNPTGLLRVHLPGANPQLGPSDGATAGGGLAVGPAWSDADGRWHRLAEQRVAGKVEILEEDPKTARFRVVYAGVTGGLTRLQQTVTVEPGGVAVADEAEGPRTGLRVDFPMLVFDGAEETKVVLTGRSVRLSLRGAWSQFAVLPPGSALTRTGQRVAHRNGEVEAVSSLFPDGRAAYRLTAGAERAAPRP